MSSSFSVYVGTYMKVPTFVRPDTIHGHACSAACGGRHAAKLNATTAFCPDCGAPVAPTERQNSELTVPSPYGFGSGFDDFASMPESCWRNARRQGHVVWMPNLGGFGIRLSSEDADMEGGALELEADERDQSMVSFIDKYGPFIRAAEAHFGVTIEVCYGVVPYAH